MKAIPRNIGRTPPFVLSPKVDRGAIFGKNPRGYIASSGATPSPAVPFGHSRLARARVFTRCSTDTAVRRGGNERERCSGATVSHGGGVRWDVATIPSTRSVIYAIRTQFGRPNASIRFRTAAARATSFASVRSVRDRWASPITRLCRDFRAGQCINGSIRARNSSVPARPYIERFRILRRLICPSVCPLLHVSLMALRTASISRRR
jgi:hypothetical protein